MRALLRFALAAIATVAAVASCAELFEEPAQCKFERDCDRFGDATCDLARGVCVPKSAFDAGEDAPTGPGSQPDAEADAPEIPDRCKVSPKPTETVPTTAVAAGTDAGPDGEITTSVTLDCGKDCLLKGRVIVRAGATLTIEPGTTIRVEKASAGGLVIMPGAKIVAAGQRNAPIVFTSAEATPAPGDWRGVYVLGVAPPTQPAFQGDPLLASGGVNAEDDSGTLSYVRIEYGAIGLVFASVGRRTKVDYVQVRKTTDNCFWFYGGAVDAKHLVCQYPLDEYYEFERGYAGRVQFLFGQKTPLAVNGRNGVLADNASPVLYNATLCGDDQANLGYGLVPRNGTNLDLANAILTGWYAGIDTVGALGTIEARSSIAFGNATNPAYVEDPAQMTTTDPTFNDDQGFDEIAWFRDPARGNRETDPGLVGCYDPKAPKPWPAAALTAGARTPPNDGFFDTTAAYIGAFRDGTDDWLSGWARFDDQ